MEYAFAPTAVLLRGAWGASRAALIRRPSTFNTSSISLINHRRVVRVGTTVRDSASASVDPSISATASAVPTGKRMASQQIRDSFLAFYADRGHTRRPSASLVPDDPTILLTIAGMVPFKPIFLGVDPAPSPPRATTSQKCIRTNDIENVGVTKRHHTFFEMLGNFSFGDYFKRQAIEWAWELLTVVYAIPPERLAVSVFEDDDEAFAIWRDVVGVQESRISCMGAKDNFWASGPTGPCGPCSEIYYDFIPSSSAAVDLEDDNRFIELYNLVFMQYSRGPGGELTPLDAQNIDTGMGLERMAQVLQQVDNNYETDLIRPIMDCVAGVAGLTYDDASAKNKVSLKVAGDHIRAVSHLISDGVRASNVGRGYIVRRLIRRVVRHGRLLGIDRPFIGAVLPTVASLAGEAGLHSVPEKLADIAKEIQREEERFLTTLERGETRLAELVANATLGYVSGADAFELYDTYGFPVELTEEIAAEHNLSVDVPAFEVCMDEQRVRARAARASGALDVEGAAVLAEVANSAGPTAFDGYASTFLPSVTVKGIVSVKSGAIVDAADEGDQIRLLLNETPFYAEGGGQVGDRGLLKMSSGAVVRIDDTRRESGVYVHMGTVLSGKVILGCKASAQVDETSRRRIQAHHTATHLLQAALKEVVSEGDISQAGSLVDADRLRFDFNCSRPVSQVELGQVEVLINAWIESGHSMHIETISIDMAKERGAVAMFGEKYGDEVRVVDVPGVSMELCGGTHVNNTADIGLFKITSESGPSSGVRRIEAVCGPAVMPYLTVRDDAVRQLCTALKARPEELATRVSSLQEELRIRAKELDVARAQVAIAKSLALESSVETRGDRKLIIAEMDEDISADSLKAGVERLAQRLGDDAVLLLASKSDGKVSFVCSVGKSLQKGKSGLNAGKLVGAVAKVCGGGGGGRPNLAQAGGRDSSKLNVALATGRALIEAAMADVTE
jgi:alanyl-tRNA synthetase